MPGKVLLITLVLILSGSQLEAALQINEFATNTSDDWIELALVSPVKVSKDISKLYVTMYYGNNEPLGTDPVTIYSYDRPETPYDDRYVVVHCARPGEPDETDLTGDTNGNGYIDVYCNNYFASLWNTEGVVSIDSDDDPSNGGILDLVYYSNRDGKPNDSIASYVAAAQSLGQWQAFSGDNLQECAVFIGSDGLSSYASVARKNQSDSNTAADFAVTDIQTPGKPNMTGSLFMGKRLFKPLRKKITIIPGHLVFGSGCIPVFVFAPCAIKLRVFSVTGMLLHESPLFPTVNPGPRNLIWNPLFMHKKPCTGLYLCKIEAVNPALKLSQEETIFIMLSHYR